MRSPFLFADYCCFSDFMTLGEVTGFSGDVDFLLYDSGRSNVSLEEIGESLLW